MASFSRKNLYTVMVCGGFMGLGLYHVIQGPELWQRVLGGIGALIFAGLLWRIPSVDGNKA